MSQKKKIKINIDAEEIAKNENTEKPAPADDKPLKSETRDAENADAENPLKEMEAKFEAKEEEAKETYDRFLRISADFENYKNGHPAKWRNLENTPTNLCSKRCSR
jgi:molecular chaperone GrpE